MLQIYVFSHVNGINQISFWLIYIYFKTEHNAYISDNIDLIYFTRIACFDQHPEHIFAWVDTFIRE